MRKLSWVRRRRNPDKIELPKTQMPIAPLNRLCQEDVGWFGGSGDDDDSFITSAYCDKDEIQWLYFRRVTRGFSDLDKVECEVCGGDLFVNEKRGSFLTSSVSPEVVGWLKVEGETLNLVLTESSCETHGEDLLTDILSHEFSGSISKVSLHQITSNLTREIRLALKSTESSLKLIETRNVPTRRRKPKRKSGPPKSDDLSESPLQIKSELSQKHLESMKRFLKNPRADAYKWSTTRSLCEGSSSSEMLPMKLSRTTKLALGSFDTWTPQARALKRTGKNLGTKKRVKGSSTEAARFGSSKKTGCRRGT